MPLQKIEQEPEVPKHHLIAFMSFLHQVQHELMNFPIRHAIMRTNLSGRSKPKLYRVWKLVRTNPGFAYPASEPHPLVKARRIQANRNRWRIDPAETLFTVRQVKPQPKSKP